MLSDEELDKLVAVCYTRARLMQNSGLSIDMELPDLVKLLYEMEIEKLQKEAISDALIGYDDEIVSIEEVGELDTVDITVTGDQLFYCNGILTKNSMGLPHTVDAMFALITSEQLQEMNQLMIKQLKNRWGDISHYRRFVVGIDRAKMKLYDLEDDAQKSVMNETPNPVNKNDDNKPKSKFGNFDDWETSND